MKSVVVRYTVKPEYAETNAANIRAVMAELRELGDAAIRYQSFRAADDPNQFIHIGFYADEAAVERATSLASFKRFQTALKESGPVSPPSASWMALVDAGHELFS
jgi:quinol monooxygenase YgiN